jgi:hypothetical protein
LEIPFVQDLVDSAHRDREIGRHFVHTEVALQGRRGDRRLCITKRTLLHKRFHAKY